MIRLQSENLFPVDVDLTLISGRRTVAQTQHDIPIKNPYTGEIVYVEPIQAHVDLVKESYGRGRLVLVWSAAGEEWANAVVEALELIEYVGATATKPYAYVDDKDVTEWMPQRVFLSKEDRA